MRRRRRRSTAGGVVAPEEAFDLFLDALANTLGVVMFIAIMVVLFAAPPESSPGERRATPAPDPTEAKVVTALLAEAAVLEEEIARAPMEGDPRLRQQAEALQASMRERRDSISRTLAETAAASDEVSRSLRAATDALRDARELQERRRRLERRIESIPESASFVRVSRFRDDPRPPVLLLLAHHALERAQPAPGEDRLLPGARQPRRVASAEEARAALAALLPGVSPRTHRIEIGVWSDSFAEYKVLERLLVEQGFDINPLPVQAGEALLSGAGGVQ